MVSRNKRLLQRLRVPLGLVFAALFLYLADPRPATAVAGALVSTAGLLIRAWASGHIRKNRDLAVSGPYSYTRNPLYLGSFLMCVGFCIAGGVWWLALLFIGLFLGIYLPVMSVEAEDLTQIFGEAFAEYARNVPLFFPRLTPWKKNNVKYDLQLYLRYREYRAALGVLLAWGVLAAKILFLR